MAGIESPRQGRVNIAAIRDTEVGQLVQRCMARELNELDRLRERAGIDFLQDVEEFAFSDELIVMTGNFAAVRAELLPHSGEAIVEPYGDGARIAQKETGFGATFGLYGDNVLIVAPKRANIEAAIDRLEGRSDVEPARLGTGDITGRAPLTDLIGPIPVPGEARDAIRGALEDSGLDFEYDVDVGDGVNGTAAVYTEDSTDLQGVGGALTGALAAGQALADDPKIEALLGGLEIDSGSDHVTLRGDFSTDTIKTLLGDCAEDAI